MSFLWIMTIILTGMNGAASITTQEYYSQSSCTASKEVIEKEFNDGWQSKKLLITCTEK